MMKPKAIDHVGLKVTDMDRSLSFYCDGLGLKLLRRSGKSPGIASAAVAAVNITAIHKEVNVCRSGRDRRLHGCRPAFALLSQERCPECGGLPCD